MKYEKTVRLKDGRECLIRNATAADAREIYDIFILTHDQTDFLASYGDETDFDVAFEQSFLAGKEESEREVYLCAVADGRIVGTAGVDAVGGSKARHRAEFGIGIDRAHWGAGIGRALTAACIECAKNAGFAQIELSVVGDNARALALYKNIGFEEYGRNPKGFYSRLAGFQELVLMRMELL